MRAIPRDGLCSCDFGLCGRNVQAAIAGLLALDVTGCAKPSGIANSGRGGFAIGSKSALERQVVPNTEMPQVVIDGENDFLKNVLSVVDWQAERHRIAVPRNSPASRRVALYSHGQEALCGIIEVYAIGCVSDSSLYAGVGAWPSWCGVDSTGSQGWVWCSDGSGGAAGKSELGSRAAVS